MTKVTPHWPSWQISTVFPAVCRPLIPPSNLPYGALQGGVLCTVFYGCVSVYMCQNRSVFDVCVLEGKYACGSPPHCMKRETEVHLGTLGHHCRGVWLGGCMCLCVSDESNRGVTRLLRIVLSTHTQFQVRVFLFKLSYTEKLKWYVCMLVSLIVKNETRDKP